MKDWFENLEARERLFVAGGAPGWALAAGLVAAAALGFLPWNVPPARVFMGDAGSVPLGLALGFLSLAGPGRCGDDGDAELTLEQPQINIDAGRVGQYRINLHSIVADGYRDLLALGPPGALAVYGEAVRRDGRHGAGPSHRSHR